MTSIIAKNISVLALLTLISVVFLYMIRSFLVVILLAAIFSAMMHPIYRWFSKFQHVKGPIGAMLTLASFTGFILTPMLVLAGIITGQAIKLSRTLTPTIQRYISEPGLFSEYIGKLPFYDQLLPYRDQILKQAGEMAGMVSSFLINNLSAGALGTVNVIFMFSIFLYISFYLLQDGHTLICRILYLLPLDNESEGRLIARFTEVTRATLKGTLIIGGLQGLCGGIIFYLVGIDAAVFWGTLMAALSVIPAVGATLIWLPAGLLLLMNGLYVKGVLLMGLCAIVLGALDNVARPIMVGRDAKMHDVMIFLGTMGGLSLFGLPGFIIGPVIAALFITIWEIYGETFKSYLPPVELSTCSVDLDKLTEKQDEKPKSSGGSRNIKNNNRKYYHKKRKTPKSGNTSKKNEKGV